MKVLVTGHKGFIGSHVYSHLVGLGFDVTGIDLPVDIGILQSIVICIIQNLMW